MAGTSRTISPQFFLLRCFSATLVPLLIRKPKPGQNQINFGEIRGGVLFFGKRGVFEKSKNGHVVAKLLPSRTNIRLSERPAEYT